MKKDSTWLVNALAELKKLDLEERKIQVRILELLLEIETQKAYSDLGYDGLFSFCVKELHYTEAQAFSRIQAMHATKTVPEIKEKIESGTMNLTTVAQVQVFIRQEQVNEGIKRTTGEKRDLFTSFENKTTKQVKAQIAELKGERVKLKLAIELDEEAESLWQQVKSLSAHQNQGSELKLLKILMKEYLSRAERKVRPRRTEQKIKPRRTSSGLSEKADVKTGIPIQTRRQVFGRDHYRCLNCGSKHALQIDHIVPRALGGTNIPENLRTLCRSCNLRAAVEVFGVEKVRSH